MAAGSHRRHHGNRRLASLAIGGVTLLAAIAGVQAATDRDSPGAGPVAPARTRVPSGEGAAPEASSAAPARPALPSTSVAPPAGPLNVYSAPASGEFSPAVAGVPERVYVPNVSSGTISVIDPARYRVIDTILVAGRPHHITPDWNLRQLYVDNPARGLLQTLDPKTGKLGRTIDVPAPYNLYFTPDGTKAIVVSEYDQTLQFRDRRTWKVLKDVPIPGQGVDHMDFSADGSYLLVSCEYTGTVAKVDTVHVKLVNAIDVGGKPIDVKVSPDGSVFFVANQGRGGVSVIDAARMKEIAFINTGEGSHGFAVSRDAAQLYNSNRLAGTISVISFATRTVVATWHVGGSPDMLQVSPDGTELWASNRFGNTVSVISTKTGRVIHTIVVGQEPHGLAYFPQPGNYSIGHNGVYR